MRLGFISLGCAKNLVDSEYMLGMFKNSDVVYESDPAKCDVIIINTCGFIESAKKEAIDTILEMAEYKKGRLKKLIVCGCLSQRYKEELKAEIPEVDAFVKIDEYAKLDAILRELLGDEKIGAYGKERVLVTQKHYAYLKIAEGCDNRCAYCAIPLIRGDCRSYPIEDLIAKAKTLYQKGVKELNVIAQDTTYYGHDIYGRFALKDLLLKLDEIPFKWIRVLYMYPDEITDDLLQAMAACKRVIPYFDIPTQYGNDELLKLMNRRGSVALIKERIRKIRELFAHAVIRTTLIVGFPHETDATFKDTLSFVQECRFDSLGAFTYSKEEGTKAYDYDHEVSPKIANERYDILMQTQAQIIKEINTAKIGKEYEVVIEGYEELFDRYIARAYFTAPDDVDGKIYVKSDRELTVGTFYRVKVIKVDTYDLYTVTI